MRLLEPLVHKRESVIVFSEKQNKISTSRFLLSQRDEGQRAMASFLVDLELCRGIKSRFISGSLVFAFAAPYF